MMTKVVAVLVLALPLAAASALAEEETVVTRPVGAATVAVDPATGRLVPPTAEQRRRLVEALTQMIDQRTDDLVVERRASGTRILRLDGRFANVTLVALAPDGAPRLQCVAEPEAALAWLEALHDPGPSGEER